MSHRLEKISGRFHKYRREEEWWSTPERRDPNYYYLTNSLIPNWLKSMERDSQKLATLLPKLTKNTKRVNELKLKIDSYIVELLLRYPRGK